MIGAIGFAGAGVTRPGGGARRGGGRAPVAAARARAASRGDEEAFARPVDLHQPVLGLCLRLLGDPEEARDAAQECFVRAWAPPPWRYTR